MIHALLVLCTCPDEASAQSIADALVEARLAACVNRLPGVASTYRWQGKVHRDREHLLLIKTTRERFPALRDRVVALHPYDLPEVLALDVVDGFDRYLAWIDQESSGADS